MVQFGYFTKNLSTVVSVLPVIGWPINWRLMRALGQLVSEIPTLMHPLTIEPHPNEQNPAQTGRTKLVGLDRTKLAGWPKITQKWPQWG